MWTDEDEKGVLYPHEDALVIKATVASKKFDRILIDTGSSVDVLFKSTLEEMGIADRKLEYTNTSLKGFGGGKLVPLGVVELPITIGSSPTERTIMLDFVVVDEEGPYQMILDLNKACPKDSFPLLKIDQLVDSTAGHGLLSFMDAFSGYNQIPMHEQDEENTAFITNQGLFYYRVMPFGLKNAGATYQRLVNKVFKPLIGRTMEVYVDDMITKSKIPEEHVRHLDETFELLRKYKMKLNPEKCAFGVESGKFLGFMVSHRGIEANPEKIQAVAQMKSPRNLKEMQSLTGKLAALSRFISKPLRQTLHKPDASGRLVKWAVELSEFDIDYKPRAAIKAQAMADFVAEFTEPEVCLDQQDAVIGSDETQVWQMSVDGSSGERGSGAGIVLEGPEGEEISYAAVKADRVKIRTDSQLVANHVNERFQPREEKMEQYLKIVKQMMGKFEAVEVIQIPREQNSRADILARMAAVADPKMPKSVPLEVKSGPSIEQNLGVLRIEQKCSWRDPIVSYLRDGSLPPDKLRARKIRAQASRYTMIDGVLYRRGYTLPFLRCLDEDDADYENDEQICLNLDLLTEKREQAAKRSGIYQQRVARYYNQKVNIRQFRVGDWQVHVKSKPAIDGTSNCKKNPRHAKAH
ncbi:uncharacterized protein LOC127899311 [Citrus sinensis]|uniref:uncharacterized protein LOC127899311 n=1 Tax=Citrus sinensis TaxID=2711 RepID=UPI002277CC0E|nr:uncharacterized protein LOC127899311 [Citrus sinensis]